MKYLIGLSVIGLLCSGCSKSSNVHQREHLIVCVDPVDGVTVTKNVVSSKNVYAFVVKGHSVLFYTNRDTNKKEIILLTKNDCEIY